MRQDEAEKDARVWQESLLDAVEAIAGMTAVDGATVITDQYELLAFGAKIGRREGGTQVEQVIVTEPVFESAASVVHPVQLGGTRHLSAAQFVQDQTDAVALVASQDGRFTIFAWSPCEHMVHAHRVETLLL
jgi:DNA integrity scanning protein DisA with diadenylate cyclase activity